MVKICVSTLMMHCITTAVDFFVFYLSHLQEVVYLALSILPNIECVPQLRSEVPQTVEAHA